MILARSCAKDEYLIQVQNMYKLLVLVSWSTPGCDHTATCTEYTCTVQILYGLHVLYPYVPRLRVEGKKWWMRLGILACICNTVQDDERQW